MDEDLKLRVLSAVAPMPKGPGEPASQGPVDSDVEVLDVDGSDVWVRVALAQTTQSGVVVAPFVRDAGGGRWLQGWSDGDILTLASSSGSALLIVDYVREFFAACPLCGRRGGVS